ncbi:C-type lectin BPL [Amia ocellicauda]|uniref:C-type lectin BPL n=1 Tax=Amia ocellicauda TaxID=2972642 RepID=UPI0034642ECC
MKILLLLMVAVAVAQSSPVAESEPVLPILREEASNSLLEAEEQVSNIAVVAESGPVPESEPVLPILGEEAIDSLLEEEEEVSDAALSTRSCMTGAFQGHCYLFFSSRKTAPEAEFFCRDNFPGGHLASVTNRDLHGKLMNLVIASSGDRVPTWIGAYNFKKTGRFLWLDGSFWSYSDWMSGEPNNLNNRQFCVEMGALGNSWWRDTECTQRQAFICSYPYSG